MMISSALVALMATAVAAIKPLTLEGADFLDSDGNKFQIVGVAYQPGGSAGYSPGTTGEDPLSHPETCMRDAALMQALGVNAIRVYNLSPDINHDECASIFNAAGMYMMLDVNSPLVGEAITTDKPWESYYMEYLNRTFAIVEAFAGYPNTLLFYSANEVINDLKSAEFVPPYLRAVTRDLKNYIKNNIDRQIPIGYSAADVRDVLWDTYNYVVCAEDGDADDMSRVDFFSLNSYSWCGVEATFQTSSFDDLVAGFGNTPVPVFFSEYGCNETPDRYWNETKSIYGPDMNAVFSGGVVYEWTQEDNNYGLVEIKGDTTHILDDYVHLKEKFSEIDWESVQSMQPRQRRFEVQACSSRLIKETGFPTNFTLPAVPPGAQRLIDNGINPKPSGKLVDISDYSVSLKVVDVNGNPIQNLAVEPLADDEINWAGKNGADTGAQPDGSNDSTTGDSSDSSESENADEDNAGMMAMPMAWAAALPLVAVLFA